MDTIKEAADSLLSKGSITQDQYDSLADIFEEEKTAAVPSSKYLNLLMKRTAKDLIGSKGGSGRMKVLEKALDIPVNAAKSITDEAAKILVPKYLNPKPNAFMQLANNMKGIGLPVAGLAAAGIAGKEIIYNPIAEKVRTNNAFNTMSLKVPQLQGKDKKEIKEYFNVVKTFSPTAASNPLVAGALVNKMMEFGGVDHKLVQDIAAIEKGLERPSIVQSATESAAKTLTAAPDLF